MKYLRAIEKSDSFSSDGGRDKDFVFVGTSRPPYDAWRIIVVHGQAKPRVVWDSLPLALRDPYFDVTGPSSIDFDADGADGYIVTLQGCAPHQCADGRMGFAIYASQTRRTYISHITTRDDGSYRVTYYPRSGIPNTYHDELNRMMCSDNGISRPSMLPIKCPTK